MQETSPSVRAARWCAGLVVVLVPAALVASGLLSRALGRGVLLLAEVLALGCLVASASVVHRDPEARGQAGLLVVGAVCVLGGSAYLWSVRDVPSAIPIGGVLGILVGLVLLAAGALALRPTRSRVG